MNQNVKSGWQACESLWMSSKKMNQYDWNLSKYKLAPVGWRESMTYVNAPLYSVHAWTEEVKYASQTSRQHLIPNYHTNRTNLAAFDTSSFNWMSIIRSESRQSLPLHQSIPSIPIRSTAFLKHFICLMKRIPNNPRWRVILNQE